MFVRSVLDRRGKEYLCIYKVSKSKYLKCPNPCLYQIKHRSLQISVQNGSSIMYLISTWAPSLQGSYQSTDMKIQHFKAWNYNIKKDIYKFKFQGPLLKQNKHPSN